MTIGYLPQEGLALCGRSVFAECLSVFAELRSMEQEIGDPFHHSWPSSTRPRRSTLRLRIASLIWTPIFARHNGYALDAQVGTVFGRPGLQQA